VQQFEELGLSATVLKALEEMGFENPTEIQQLSIPALLSAHTDMLGLAQTGTGKTAAFGLPLVEYALTEKGTDLTALVLAPTRELAIQIKENLDSFTKYAKNFECEVVYGGSSIQNQIRSLKRNKTQILIATPGRLIDLMERRVVRLDQVKRVVLDEADEMLNMGFQEDIDRILQDTPDDRNIWLFSATMPSEIRRIISEYMTDPVEVKSSAKLTINSNIEHKYIRVSRNNKVKALRNIIESYEDLYGVVFCRTRMETQRVADELREYGYPAEALHGDMSQAFREAVMKRFRAGQTKLLVATDVAARGIDVDNLTHVIHFALPDDITYYTHRSGRTARAGRKGMSIAIIQPQEEGRLRSLKGRLGVDITHMEVPSGEEIMHKRFGRRAKELLEANVPNIPEKIVDAYFGLFQTADPNLLLETLLYEDLNRMLEGLPAKRENLNAQSTKRNRDVGERGGERSRARKGDPNDPDTIFMNMGRIDGLDKQSLMHFIEENSGVTNAHIGKIELQKQITFIEVAPEAVEQFMSGMSNAEYNGRTLRVNNDANPISDSGGGRSRGGGSKRGYGGGGNRSRGRSGGGSRSGGSRSGGGRSGGGRPRTRR